MNSIMIIGGNEPYPEGLAIGYRTALSNFQLHAEYNLQSFWGVDYNLMRSAMQKSDNATIRRLLNGCLSESSRLEFPFIVFASPEMYFWERQLRVYPSRGQILQLVPAVKDYIATWLLPQVTDAHLGVIGSAEGVALFTDIVDSSVATRHLRYSYGTPSQQTIDRLTGLRYAKSPPDLQQARALCTTAIADITAQSDLDGIIVADLETERWLKGQSYHEHLAELAAHNRLHIQYYCPEHQHSIFILSAMQALVALMARECSYPRILDFK